MVLAVNNTARDVRPPSAVPALELINVALRAMHRQGSQPIIPLPTIMGTIMPTGKLQGLSRPRRSPRPGHVTARSPLHAAQDSALDLRHVRLSPQLTVTISLLALLVLAALAIVVADDGQFFYTLDAPYTHLALAEQIRHGTYGLNAGEPAAPSSTILYPLLLVPLLGLGQYGPMLLCVAATLGSGLAVCALAETCGIRLSRIHPLQLAAITVSLAVALNVIGVALTGLEHALHTMLTILSLLGLVRFMQRGRSDWWWLLTIALLPLVRFESMSAVLTDAFVLAVFNRRAYAALVLAAGFSLIFAFALFLHSQGLPYLPTSVTARSGVASSGLGMQAHHGVLTVLHSVVASLKRNLLSFGATQILLLMVFAGWRLGPFLSEMQRRVRHPRTDASLLGGGSKAGSPAAPGAARFVTPAAAGFFILIAAAQLLAGSLQSAGRYEVYLFSLGACSLMVCYRDRVAAFVETMRVGQCIGVCLTVLALFAGYVIRTVEDVSSSQTLYLGSAQIRRFVADDYRNAFAITRPGLVKFRNPYPMLDLSGLASAQVQRAITTHNASDTEWMNKLVRQHGIGLAIVYTDTRTTPPFEWTPVAELRTSNASLGIDGSIATFYAVTPGDVRPILDSLHRFGSTLPPRASLQFRH